MELRADLPTHFPWPSATGLSEARLQGSAGVSGECFALRSWN